jgi:shikimate kinase
MSQYNSKQLQFIGNVVYNRLTCPVALIGLMGAGKTRLGRLMAKNLGLDFKDSDYEIEQAAGCSIAEIFEIYGEQGFRDGEHRVMRRLISEGPRIIATGGGAVMTREVADMLFANTISIWVKAPLEVMVERASRNDRRPLLQTGEPPEDIFQRLIDQRYPVYERADIVVYSGTSDSEEPLYQAIDKLYAYLVPDHDVVGD